MVIYITFITTESYFTLSVAETLLSFNMRIPYMGDQVIERPLLPQHETGEWVHLLAE
jgi:hypothetical protein